MEGCLVIVDRDRDGDALEGEASVDLVFQVSETPNLIDRLEIKRRKHRFMF